MDLFEYVSEHTRDPITRHAVAAYGLAVDQTAADPDGPGPREVACRRLWWYAGQYPGTVAAADAADAARMVASWPDGIGDGITAREVCDPNNWHHCECGRGVALRGRYWVLQRAMGPTWRVSDPSCALSVATRIARRPFTASGSVTVSA